MRRIALALCLVVSFTACSDGSSRRVPPTPTPRVLPGLPPLVVASGSTVSRYVSGRLERVGKVDGIARVAIDAGDDGIVVEHEVKTRLELVLMNQDADPPVTQLRMTEAPEVHLHDIVKIGDNTQVLFDAFDQESLNEVKGYLMLGDLQSGTTSRVTESFAPEFGLTRASYGGEAIVTSANTDLTETVSFYDREGTRIERPSPTDDLPYNQPPYVTQAVLSPDGKLLAHLEGPDTSFESPERSVGDWEAVVSDEVGEERLRIRIGNRDECLSWLDFDGRWLIISRTLPSEKGQACDWDGKQLSVVAVDANADKPTAQELNNVSGTATIAA